MTTKWQIGDRHPDHEFLYVCDLEPDGRPIWTTDYFNKRHDEPAPEQS